MSKIVNVLAREVLDSRGDPTIEVEITTEKGNVARAIVPSGASTGEREALELRDHDEKRYLGKGVLKAVSNVNQVLKPYVIGKEVESQKEIDDLLIQLDGTKDKSKFGANAILGISLAVSKASSLDQNLPYYDFLGKKESYLLPVPMMNVINGGSHADSSVDFQEYMIVPVGASSIREAIRMSSEVFHHLKKILKEDGHITSVGDEGGFAPNLSSNEEPFKYIMKAIFNSGYIPGDDFVLAIDVAASEFYNKETKHYEFKKSHGGEKTTEEMISYLEELVEKYPIFSIEDGLGENDMEGWKELTRRLGDKIQLVGDDLFVTNPSIFKEGIQEGLANAILIKVNQVGTISETIETVKMAKASHYHTIISHRSGETEDTSIAHLALALETGQIKTGSMSRTDRICKYNELIRIEEKLKDHAIYAGKSILKKK